MVAFCGSDPCLALSISICVWSTPTASCRCIRHFLRLFCVRLITHVVSPQIDKVDCTNRKDLYSFVCGIDYCRACLSQLTITHQDLQIAYGLHLNQSGLRAARSTLAVETLRISSSIRPGPHSAAPSSAPHAIVCAACGPINKRADHKVLAFSLRMPYIT